MKGYIEYLLLLLPAPVKRVKNSLNYFVILCRFIGTLFDEAMEQLFFAREQTKILSCAPELLSEHGCDRGVPQFEGESADAYRDRLIAHFDIAQKAGITEGIRLAIHSIGYRNIFLEPVRKTDPNRWAEFFVWISDKVENVPVDLALLDREITKVKRATSKAAYGVESANTAVVTDAFCCVGIYLTVEPLTVEDVESSPARAQVSAVMNTGMTITIEPFTMVSLEPSSARVRASAVANVAMTIMIDFKGD